ncbi:hypothetical protein Rs2_26456 [Raphanus sativus]|nr:hypothetical protein Rs2_26456 [Raphanus sativus]
MQHSLLGSYRALTLAPKCDQCVSKKGKEVAHNTFLMKMEKDGVIPSSSLWSKAKMHTLIIAFTCSKNTETTETYQTKPSRNAFKVEPHQAYFKCAYECFDRIMKQEEIANCFEHCSVPVVKIPGFGSV